MRWENVAEKALRVNMRTLLEAGTIATIAITAPMYLARWLGISRLDLPVLLGSFVRPAPGQARLAGMAPHMLGGVLIFPMAYRVVVSILDLPRSRRTGILLGVPHWIASCVALAILGRVNPRAVDHGDAASAEQSGNVLVPGAFGQRYGLITPPALLVGHLVYGAIVGWSLGREEAHDK